MAYEQLGVTNKYGPRRIPKLTQPNASASGHAELEGRPENTGTDENELYDQVILVRDRMIELIRADLK